MGEKPCEGFAPTGPTDQALDIMTSVTGLDFFAAWERKVIADFGGEQAAVLCREDVLRSKIAVGRIRDRQDAQRLGRSQS